MVTLASLWLPILLSAVAVFIASSIIHMAPLWHKNDYPKVPNEDALRAALGPLKLPPGDYMVPRGESHADMKKPEFIQKLKDGPVVAMTVLPTGEFKMGPTLGQWFVFTLVVSAFAGCLAGCALPGGAGAHRVFHQVALAAAGGYALAIWPMSIWYKRAWSMSVKATLDGVIYGVLTGLIFAWLWPHAA